MTELKGGAAIRFSHEPPPLFGSAVHNEDYDRVWHAIEEALTWGKVCNVRYRVKDGEGNERTIVVFGQAIDADNQKETRASRFVGLAVEVAGQSAAATFTTPLHQRR